MMLACGWLYKYSGEQGTISWIVAVPLQMGVKTGTVARALTDNFYRLPSVGTCFDVGVAGVPGDAECLVRIFWHGFLCG